NKEHIFNLSLKNQNHYHNHKSITHSRESQNVKENSGLRRLRFRCPWRRQREQRQQLRLRFSRCRQRRRMQVKPLLRDRSVLLLQWRRRAAAAAAVPRRRRAGGGGGAVVVVEEWVLIQRSNRAQSQLGEVQHTRRQDLRSGGGGGGGRRRDEIGIEGETAGGRKQSVDHQAAVLEAVAPPLVELLLLLLLLFLVGYASDRRNGEIGAAPHRRRWRRILGSWGGGLFGCVGGSSENLDDLLES
ncbi:unnamed protein product, partial [Linum tenue]